MIDITGKKARFLVISLFLLFTVGNVSALTWENPSPDQSVPGEVELNVSNDQDSDWINFDIQGPNDVDENVSGVTGQDYVTYEFSAGSGGSGQYTVEASDDTGSTASIDFLLDRTNPEVTKKDDRDYVQDDPSISFSVSDDYTAVTDFNASGFAVTVEDGEKTNVCSAGGECTVSVETDTEDLTQGDTFTLDVEASDLVGNTFQSSQGEFSYTLDTSFQADEPEFEIPDADEDRNVDLNGDVDVDIEVSNIDEEESDVRVKCIVDGDEVDTTDWDDSEDFSCEIPSEDVDDETVDVQVEACDRAENCDSSSEYSYTFDSSDPVMDEIEFTSDYSVFTDDFEVSYEASDTASGVDELEYFFSPGTSEGEGTTVEYDGEDSFRADTALIDEDGEHTIYVRAKDNVGRWSDIESLDFEYYPDEEPRISIDAQDDFTVESTSSKYIDVVVENTGKLLVESAEISSDSPLVNETNTVEDLEEGDSVNSEFEINPTEFQTGLWNITFSSEEPEASDTVEILVEANEDQRQRVDQRLAEFNSRLDDLQSNASDLREEGLESELNSSLDSELSNFSATVESIQGYVDSGEYHRALAEIEALDAEYNSASNTLDNVEEEHEANQFRQTLMMLAVGLLIILAGVGAFIYTGKSEDFDLKLPEGWDLSETDSEIPVKIKTSIQSVKDSLNNLREKVDEEEEKAEKAFEGFK